MISFLLFMRQILLQPGDRCKQLLAYTTVSTFAYLRGGREESEARSGLRCGTYTRQAINRRRSENRDWRLRQAAAGKAGARAKSAARSGPRARDDRPQVVPEDR